ncbi:MAG TPA: phosphotransferase, partial [Acidimicrobiia bacterium]|nr:phosphotransferase [Acidimicrobiia bacterium]
MRGDGSGPGTGEIAELLERELGGSWEAQLVARSSNSVYRCRGPSGEVAVRVPAMDRDRPSPFWRQMRAIFGLSFPPTMAQVGTAADMIARAGLHSSRPVAAIERESAGPVLVTTWVDGESWEPDRFPPSPDVHRMFGRFLARMHEHRYPG